jgi:2-octaprenyl-6-methoxyphenol hydroxylase
VLDRRTEVVVIGGGPAGLTAAIVLASVGVETVLVAKRSHRADNRTTALLAGSVTALDTLGVWARCRAQAAALRAIRIVDDTRRLLRAPEMHFEAAEIGLDAFGYNIENRHLLAALETRAREFSALLIVEEEAQTIELDDAGVRVCFGNGTALAARLIVGADGRQSLCRKAAGIESRLTTYPQTALTFNLGHDRPHQDCSTEFHTERGPFTLVPLPGRRSSLVFVVDPAQLPRLTSLGDDALAIEIERRSHSILGKITIEPGRGVFPLVIETTQTFATRRAALVGEAAHVIPPIGAQGLNLGLRDAATIGEIVADARRRGDDVGSVAVLARYNDARGADVTTRTLAVDLLNRSLLTDFLPVQGARGLGLWLMQQIGPLRRAVMREGVAPSGAQPRLMRGEAL